MDLETLQATTRGLLPEVLGIRFTKAEPDLIEAELFVTQTQIVLPKEPSPEEQMGSLFATGETPDHQSLLARLERSGGAMYRRWAEQETDVEVRSALLAAADREDENAKILEDLAKRRSE